MNRFLFLFLLCYGLKASAQSFEVPKNYSFNKQTNYAQYEADIIKAADWLQRTPWTAEPEKREVVTQFLLKWTQGVPYITVELKQPIMDISDTNPQLGFIYMGQYCKYAIEHKADFNPLKATAYALRAVAAKYKVEPARKTDSDVQHIIALDEKGELEAWIANDFGL